MQDFPADIHTEDAMLMMRGQSAPFQHADRNIRSRFAAPAPNPLAA